MKVAVQLEAFLTAANKFDWTKWNQARQLMRQIGVTWVRVVLDWRWIEFNEGTRTWDGDAYPYDRALRSLQLDGVKVLGLLTNSPPWAGSPLDVTKYHGFVQAAAMRYRGTVDHWEIWNEPNISAFWSWGPNVNDYMALLESGSDAVRLGNPDAKVISGGLAHSPDVLSWYTQMRDLGLSNYCDAVGVHAYTWNNVDPTVGASIGDFRIVDDIYNIVGQPLWLTEQGFNTAQVTEQEQADRLEASIKMVKDRPFVDAYFYFEFIDRADGWGLLKSDLSPRESFFRLASV